MEDLELVGLDAIRALKDGDDRVSNYKEAVLFLADSYCRKEEYDALLAYIRFCGDDVIYALYDQYIDNADEINSKHREG